MKLSSLLLLGVAAGLITGAGAQESTLPPAGARQLVVTAVARNGTGEPIQAQQVEVKQNGHKLAVAEWAPFTTSDQVDLAIAIDEDTQGLRTGLGDIKGFVTALPANVAVGIVYFRTGSFTVAANFTSDHAAAAAAIRPPSGAEGSSPSPYGSLRDLLQHWPNHPGVRHELVMISDGEEHAGGNDRNNQALQSAMAEAVAQGVVVYTIYATGNQDNTHSVDNTVLVPDIAGADPSQKQAPTPVMVFRNSHIDQANGNNNLSQLSKATGGESYSQGITTGSRLISYFSDIGQRLASQYRLVVAPYESGKRGLVELKLKVKDTSASITAPERIFIAKQQ